MQFFSKLLILLSFFLSSSFLHALTYKFSIDGVEDPLVIKQIKNSSQLIAHQSKGATSMKQLKNMVDNDHHTIHKLLQYNGFFSAIIHPTIVQEKEPIVIFRIDTGIRYTLNNLLITWIDRADLFSKATPEEKQALLEKGPSLEDVTTFRKGVKIHGDMIQGFEKELFHALAIRGFFHPKVLDKKCIVYSDQPLVDVSMNIETGPFSSFGPVTIEGIETVEIPFILSKLTWKEGDLYDKHKLDEFETTLLKTGLFQSVIIDCRNEFDTSSFLQKRLHVHITLQEGKQKTIGAGVSYTTTLGGGTSFQLEHRNAFGMGERLSFRGDIWQRKRNINCTYTVPHLFKSKDNTLYIIEHEYQKYLPYHSSSIKGSILRERNFSTGISCSWGLCLERLSSTRFNSSKRHDLFKLPLSWKKSSANSLWDPTSGMSLLFKLTPSVQYIGKSFRYYISSITWSGYESLSNNSITIASRFTIGSIFRTTKKRRIPVPDRFFGGTENSLRGYKTGTIAPFHTIKNKKEPIGGMSIIAGTFEIRHRYPNGFGSVLFYDLGDVFQKSVPSYRIKEVKHSCGFGFRYTTPIGPIRLDFAFPLQRRKAIDPAFQFYFSIGQSF